MSCLDKQSVHVVNQWCLITSCITSCITSWICRFMLLIITQSHTQVCITIIINLNLASSEKLSFCGTTFEGCSIDMLHWYAPSTLISYIQYILMRLLAVHSHGQTLIFQKLAQLCYVNHWVLTCLIVCYLSRKRTMDGKHQNAFIDYATRLGYSESLAVKAIVRRGRGGGKF